MRAAIVLMLICGLSTPAFAELIVPDPPPESKKTNDDFERARASAKDSEKAYSEGDYKLALMHAEAGFQIYPNASTAAVVAVVHAARKDPAQAAKYYVLALNLSPPPSTVADLQGRLVEQLDKLDTPMGWLAIDSAVDGARITVDGKKLPRGITVVGASAGEHVVKATADGYEPFEAKVTVAKGAEASLDVEMTAMPASGTGGSGTGDPNQVSKSHDGGQDITVPVALMVTGGVVLGAAIGLTVWGVGEADTANEIVSGGTNMSADQAQSQYETATSNAEVGLYTSYAGYAIGGALLVTGAVLLAIGGDDEDATSTTAAPALLPGGGGLVVGGSF